MERGDLSTFKNILTQALQDERIHILVNRGRKLAGAINMPQGRIWWPLNSLMKRSYVKQCIYKSQLDLWIDQLFAVGEAKHTVRHTNNIQMGILTSGNHSFINAVIEIFCIHT